VLRLSQWIDLLQETYSELFTAVENGINTNMFFQLRERFRNITSALESDTYKNVLDADQIENMIRQHFEKRLDAELSENGLDEIAQLIGRYSMMSPLQALASIRETEAEDA
jgi:phosphopantothenate synthetase